MSLIEQAFNSFSTQKSPSSIIDQVSGHSSFHSTVSPMGTGLAIGTLVIPLLEVLLFPLDEIESLDSELSSIIPEGRNPEGRNCRVAPASYPAGALARSGQGDFHHPAPPLIRLMKIPTGLHTPGVWAADNLSINYETASRSYATSGTGG